MGCQNPYLCGEESQQNAKHSYRMTQQLRAWVTAGAPRFTALPRDCVFHDRAPGTSVSTASPSTIGSRHVSRSHFGNSHSRSNFFYYCVRSGGLRSVMFAVPVVIGASTHCTHLNTKCCVCCDCCVDWPFSASPSLSSGLPFPETQY